MTGARARGEEADAGFSPKARGKQRSWNARGAYVAAMAAIVCAGLICRWPALGLPWPIAKYAGSALWGAMVFTGLRAVSPNRSIAAGAAAACAIAVCVELLRLYHVPALDAFRATLAGKLLLGSIFSPSNIVAYVIGIACAALIDASLARFRDPCGRPRPDGPDGARS